MRLQSIIFVAGLFVTGILISPVSAQSTPDPSDQQRRNQEQFEQLRKKNQPRSKSSPVPLTNTQGIQNISEENVCFPIEKIAFERAETDNIQNKFNWALEAANITATGDADLAIGRCLGIQSIQTVVRRVQNSIIEAGFITTRVLLGPQNLKSKQLKLTLIPGYLKDVRYKDPEIGRKMLNAIPRRADGLLFLRDIEQGLENLKRVPTAEADFTIEPSNDPSAKPGDSDLVIDWEQEKKFRFYLSADDSGSETTGKYQGGLTFSWDNPLLLNDLFYVNFNHDLGGGLPGSRGSKAISAHYSVPIGYWLAELNVSKSDYQQTVAGASQDYLYSGESENADVKFTQLFHRDASSKSRWFVAGWLKQSKNFIDDTEIEVQRRRTVGFEIGINHTRYAKSATWDFGLTHRQGIRAFGALDAPEDAFGEGASHPSIFKLNASLNTPINLLGEGWSYNGAFKAQWTNMPLVSQDRFAIGSRYTVRGFSGETTLSGELGLLFRNDITRRIGETNHNIYLGLDVGQVGGPSASTLLGKFLAGAALGVKGRIKKTNYDVFLAKSLQRPDGFDTGKFVFGFNVGLSF